LSAYSSTDAKLHLRSTCSNVLATKEADADADANADAEEEEEEEEEEAEEAEGEASDITRDLDGAPLTTDSLATWLYPWISGLDSGSNSDESSSNGGSSSSSSNNNHNNHNNNNNSSLRLLSFSAPESMSSRYKMADAARLILHFSNRGENETENELEIENEKKKTELPQIAISIFLKRAVMRDLPHALNKAVTSPHKLARDVQSYQVEHNFLGSQACEYLRLYNRTRGFGSAGALPQIPRVLFSDSHVPASVSSSSSSSSSSSRRPQDARFLTLLEDLSPADGWLQSGLLESSQLEATLRMLARFHAFFWNGRVGPALAASSACALGGFYLSIDLSIYLSIYLYIYLYMYLLHMYLYMYMYMTTFMVHLHIFTFPVCFVSFISIYLRLLSSAILQFLLEPCITYI
jgi:hypothetical protein